MNTGIGKLLLAVIPVLCGLYLAVYPEKMEKVTIHGNLKGCRDSVLYLMTAADTSISTLHDTIQVRKDGTFEVQVSLSHPSVLKITDFKSVQITFCAVPGWNIGVAGNAETYRSLQESLSFTGDGEVENSIWKQIYLSFRTTGYIHLSQEEFISSILNEINEDSLYAEARNTINYSKIDNKLKAYFLEVFYKSIKYKKLFTILNYTINNEYSALQTSQLIRYNTDTAELRKINDIYNLASPSSAGLLEGQYLDLLIKQRAGLMSDSVVTGFDRADWINSIFEGVVKDILLFKHLKTKLIYSITGTDLLKCISKIAYIEDEGYRNVLFDLYTRKKKTISDGLEEGDIVSRGYTLYDAKGASVDLRDFTGKVVVVDLWASWCGPCKQEIPYFRKITRMFPDRDKIIFISISVLDEGNELRRKKIIEFEQMDWLVLDDRRGNLGKYFNIVFIPRFVILGRRGQIMDFDAPMPSEKNFEAVIKKALDVEFHQTN